MMSSELVRVLSPDKLVAIVELIVDYYMETAAFIRTLEASSDLLEWSINLNQFTSLTNRAN